MIASVLGSLLSAAAPLALLGALGAGPERETLARVGGQSLAVSLRAVADFRYDEILVGEGGSELAYLGAVVSPPAALGRPGCEVKIARIEFGGASLSADKVSARVSLSGIEMDSDCLKPQELVMASALGPEALKIDRAEILGEYRIGASEALVLAALEASYGRADLALAADRLHLTEWTPAAPVLEPAPEPEPEPEVEPEIPEAPTEGAARPSVKIPRAPAPEEPQDWAELEVDPWASEYGSSGKETRLDGRLLRAELRGGLSPRLAATISGFAGGPRGIEGAIREGLGAQLSGGGELSGAPLELVESAARELGRVAAQGGDFVLSLNPEDPPALSALADLKGPEEAVAALRPIFSPAPPRLAALADPAEFEAALEAPDSLPAPRRIALAQALAAGEGVPRAPEAARRILGPLAEAGDAQAALALAGLTLERGEPAEAYAQALRAGASGLPAARGLLDKAEKALKLPQILTLQSAAPKPDSDALLTEAQGGGLLAMGRLARAAAEGVGRPRDYREALIWSGAAAAAGDFGASALRETLKARFSGEDQAEAWRLLSAEAEAETLRLWMNGLAQSLRKAP